MCFASNCFFHWAEQVPGRIWCFPRTGKTTWQWYRRKSGETSSLLSAADCEESWESKVLYCTRTYIHTCIYSTCIHTCIYSTYIRIYILYIYVKIDLTYVSTFIHAYILSITYTLFHILWHVNLLTYIHMYVFNRDEESCQSLVCMGGSHFQT